MEEQIRGSETASENSVVLLGNDDVRRAAELKRAQRARQRQALELQRQNILSQKTSNAGRRAALDAALAEIEAQREHLK